MEKGKRHTQRHIHTHTHTHIYKSSYCFYHPNFHFREFFFFPSRNVKFCKLYTCMEVSVLNFGAFAILLTLVLIRFGIILGKLWLRQ